MELEKRSIHMNRQKCRSVLQVTIDNDINVPDVKPDIGKIIREQGEIRLQESKVANGRVLLKGEMLFHILYVDAENEYKVSHMEGAIDINEVVNLGDSCSGDSIWVQGELEDITASIINSRKISVKAIVKLAVSAEEIIDEEAVVGVTDAGDAERLMENGTVTELALCKKDIYRIKEDITIPPGRDSVEDIMFFDMILQNVETRMMGNKFGVRGDIRMFVFYRGLENDRVNSYETSVPFSGEIDCVGCDENMIAQVDIRIQERNLEVKADEDGEDRILELEAVLGLDMRVYNETDIQLLADIYSTSTEIIPEYKDTFFNNLILKNNSKAKIQERMALGADYPAILQLCNAGAYVRIDEETVVPGGIETEGVIEISVLYFTDDDGNAIGSYKNVIPFNHFIEVKNITADCVYEINPSVDQINVTVTDEREIEVKAVIALDTIVFNVSKKKKITGCQVSERNADEINKIPGMTGYIVRKDDTLWSIAKNFLTTTQSIIDMNDLENDEIYTGQKLLLVKHIPEV